LFATGREPNTSDIGLDTVGLTPGSWPSLGHHRRRRPNPHPPALARRAVLPHDQRGLAAPARGLPRLTSTVLDKPSKREARTARPGCAGVAPRRSASRLLPDALAAAYRDHQAIEGPAGKPAHDEASARALAARAKELVGPIDVLINSAGIYPFSPTEQATEADFDSLACQPRARSKGPTPLSARAYWSDR
jgi:hypothetical protein